MAKNGLLILTQPLTHLATRISPIVEEASAFVNETLYVFLQPALQNQEVSKNTVLLPLLLNADTLAAVRDFYLRGSNVCHGLDIRVLLSHICSSPAVYKAVPFTLKKEVSILMSDSLSVRDAWNSGLTQAGILKSSFSNITADAIFNLVGDSGSENASRAELESSEGLKTYPNVVLGGTFDRLHTGHKVLLSESLLRCEKKMIVGITDGERNKKKTLWELMEPFESRLQSVTDFVSDVKPNVSFEAVKIYDPFGPTVTDPDLHCIVVSAETEAGGAMVNKERLERGFSVLDMVVIDLLEDSCRSEDEESKISSSSFRKRLLGTLLRPVLSRPNMEKIPYRVAVTGGIASGKSNVCSELEKLGAKIVNCDLLGHKAYVKSMPAYKKIVQEFGDSIVGEDGEINRQKLGQIVFSDKSQLEKLNSIVWPVIRQLAEEEISQHKKAGAQVVVLEAAVLLEAGWDDMVHEIWSTFVSIDEAVTRMMSRNKLNQEEAQKRLNSQKDNLERIARSNVVICSQWEFEYTRKQIEKAWSLLQQRIHNS